MPNHLNMGQMKRRALTDRQQFFETFFGLINTLNKLGLASQEDFQHVEDPHFEGELAYIDEVARDALREPNDGA